MVSLLLPAFSTVTMIAFVGFLYKGNGFCHLLDMLDKCPWWVTFSFFTSSPIIDVGDQITSIITLLLIPVCITDKRQWHREQKEPEYERLNIWQQYKHLFILSFLIVIKIQVSVVYFHAATAKLSVEEWTNGTALYYWFTHDVFGMGSFLEPLLMPLLLNPVLLTLMTWSVIIFEILLFAACLMSKKN